MIDIFVYPVSAVMKFWHSLAASIFDAPTAWVLSIALLVATVRGFIAPLNWLSVKSGRIGALMRPESEDLQQRLRKASTTQEAADVLREQYALKERFGYNPAIGCLPVFIIVPFFMGLYQVVLRMARRINLDHVGVLDSTDIAGFRAATLGDVPLVALARDQRGLVEPILICAITFTTLNALLTLYRGFLTTRFDQTIPRRVLWLMCIAVVLVPWMLWNTAMVGPVPVAVILYWGCSYFFALVQTLVYNAILRKRYPLTEAVHTQRRESIRRWRRPRKQRREEKKEMRTAAKAVPKETRASHDAMVAKARGIVKAERKERRKP